MLGGGGKWAISLENMMRSMALTLGNDIWSVCVGVGVCLCVCERVWVFLYLLQVAKYPFYQ